MLRSSSSSATNPCRVILLLVCTLYMIRSTSGAISFSSSSSSLRRSTPICANPKNCTSEIQSILSDPSMDSLYLRNSGSPYITLPLRLQRRSARGFHFYCDPGTVLLAMRWAFNSTGASLLYISHSANVTIENCIFKMWRQDYANPKFYTKGEWRMALNLQGNNENISILKSQFEESGGDGIYLGGNCNKNIFIQNVISRNNYRQGISVICAKKLLVENSVFEGTKGTAPQCGLDIEPDLPSQAIEGIVFRNCWFKNNTGCGIAVSLHASSDVNATIAVKFENNTIDGTDGYGVIVSIPHETHQGRQHLIGNDNSPTPEVLSIDALWIANTQKFGIFFMSHNVSWRNPSYFSKVVLMNTSASLKGGDNIATMVFDSYYVRNLVLGSPSDPLQVWGTNGHLLLYMQHDAKQKDFEYNITGSMDVKTSTRKGCLMDKPPRVKFNVSCHVVPHLLK